MQASAAKQEPRREPHRPNATDCCADRHPFLPLDQTPHPPSTHRQYWYWSPVYRQISINILAPVCAQQQFVLEKKKKGPLINTTKILLLLLRRRYNQDFLPTLDSKKKGEKKTYPINSRAVDKCARKLSGERGKSFPDPRPPPTKKQRNQKQRNSTYVFFFFSCQAKPFHSIPRYTSPRPRVRPVATPPPLA